LDIPKENHQVRVVKIMKQADSIDRKIEIVRRIKAALPSLDIAFYRFGVKAGTNGLETWKPSPGGQPRWSLAGSNR